MRQRSGHGAALLAFTCKSRFSGPVAQDTSQSAKTQRSQVNLFRSLMMALRFYARARQRFTDISSHPADDQISILVTTSHDAGSLTGMIFVK